MTLRDGRPVPVHRLRPNETVWTPPSVIFLDTETRWHVEAGAEIHRLRLWVCCHTDRRNTAKKPAGVEWGWGETAENLADWLNGRMVGRDCVWLYAHNLNFDLVTSNLAETMTARGWRVNDFAVAHGSPWLRLGKGKKTLTVVDSWSQLPTSLESLATLQGRHKVELPDQADNDLAWVRRCGVDVDLLARSILGLMAWWDEQRLGRWTISGAGCGWNAMRHTDTHQRHVINVTPELVAEDRLAVRGGRKDAAVVRYAEGGPWVELDLEAAYPTVARDLPLPVKRAWTFDRLDIDSKWIGSRFYGVIAEATITTDRPRFPVRHRGVTWYPVGTFKTWLAGPELAWARQTGCLVSVGRGQAHRLGLALRPWATWVLDPTRGGEVDVPPVARVACKAWGRAVLGKFAARSHTSELLDGPAPPGWGVTDLWDRQKARRGALVNMGGEARLVAYDADTENCYPAVLAWVESETRVRLGRVLEALDGAWWTADTDGLLVDLSVVLEWVRLGAFKINRRARSAEGVAAALCDELAPMVAPLTLRPKRSYTSLDVLGPQHVTRDGEVKMAGVARGAVEVERRRFVTRDWPGLKWQMQNSRPGEYRRPEREVTFRGPAVHRWVLDDGETRPVEMAIGADGSNEILPWALSRWASADPAPTVPQYRLVPPVAS